MPAPTLEAPSDAQAALQRACELLLFLQDPAGWWQGELQTNVTMDAEDMLLREFLSIRRDEETARSAAWIRSQQRADGTWANFHGGPGELSTTIEAYCALRLAGDDPAQEHMRTAAAFVRAHGGIQRARVFTHVWLALFGLWSWDDVPALPPEVLLLPSWAPLNVYDFACWARQTIVALSIVKAHRPVRPLTFDLHELHSDATPPPPARSSWQGLLLARLDPILRAYERRPLRPLRRLALDRAERWIVRRQEADGSWGGIQPPWVYSLMALHLRGYPLEHPLMRRGLEGIDSFMVEDPGDRPQLDAEQSRPARLTRPDRLTRPARPIRPARPPGAPSAASRRLEACQSPVWDTALAIVALTDAGLSAGDPAILRAARWLLGEEVTATGDWAVARPGLAPGGWAFEFANLNYPDVDDTAEVVLALHRVAGADLRPQIDAAIGRAERWVRGMQSSGGGWGAFDADNTRALVRELPFLDFGETIDEPSADVTAHALEMLAVLGLLDSPAARRGLRWLIAQQEPGGSWFGRWGINHLYGTGAALPALIAAGVAPTEGCVRRAVRFLERHQNEDGGWGEDPRSYDDPAWIGRGPSTASQTAWALLALHAAGESDSPALRRGVDWLARTQRADGGWDEPQYTGTGFPCDYYINYHLYRLIFPIMALGRCLAADRSSPDPPLSGSPDPRLSSSPDPRLAGSPDPRLSGSPDPRSNGDPKAHPARRPAPAG